jgi:teichoic acid transport system permease protein
MAVAYLSRTIPAVHQYARDLWQRREFAVYLALGNLRARNASTSLGLLWWVVNPLLLGGIYLLVFGGIMNINRGEDYVGYLLAGMFAFYYTRSTMVGSVNSILTNTKMLANLRFPRLVLPLSAMFESAVGFGAALVVYYPIVGLTDGVWPRLTILWLVPAFVIHSVFNFGMAALVARVAIPFRDVNNLVPYFLRLWLYLSPIIYPLSFLEDLGSGFRAAVEFNPLFPILTMYRHALMDQPMGAEYVLYGAVWAAAIFVVGVGMFIRNEARMTRYL